MLRDDMELYTKLSGNDGEHMPIGIIGGFLDGYDKGIEDATKWIPCSERLPEERGKYLVTGTQHFLPDHVDEIDYVDDVVNIDYYSTKFNDWLSGEKVYAWMPLPEPYKADMKGEQNETN